LMLLTPGVSDNKDHSRWTGAMCGWWACCGVAVWQQWHAIVVLVNDGGGGEKK
jgi:hypothetical protein